LVDLWVKINGEFLATNAEILPKEFLVDLAVTLLRDRPDKKPEHVSMANISDYLEKMD